MKEISTAMNFSLESPRRDEVESHCTICRYSEYETVVAVLRSGLKDNLIRTERLCLRHLKELKGVVEAAVEELESE